MYSPALLNIRFSASLPDLALTIDDPHRTSVLTLIRTIREQLPPPHHGLRLRLIYSGRVLASDTSLVEALRLQPDPSPSASLRSNAKGKAPIKPAPSSERRYIHATFSDASISIDLDKERKDAAAADVALVAAAQASSSTSHHGDTAEPSSPSQAKRIGLRRQSASARYAPGASVPASPATQMPQGFDRLTDAGLSAIEVASLRSQFLAILAHTHTPDTMPSAYELREMEERWLDNDAEGIAPGGGLGEAQPGAAGLADGGGGLLGRLGGNVADEDTSGLDDMLWGNLMGFFWPIGAVIWLMREEGVWTQRRKIAVVTGALVNLAFSIMRAAS